MAKYQYMPLNDNVEEMFIGPFGSGLKNDSFVDESDAFCMVYEQKHAIKKTMKLETRYVNREKYEELKRFNIHGGDIIVSCRGTIGETYIVPDDAPLGIMHPSIMKIRLKPGVYNKQYFNLLLRNHLKQHEDEANGSGIKMAISAKELGATLFPVPDMAEQNQIASAFNQVEELISLRKQQLAKLDELVKARFVELFENEEYEKATVSSVLNTGFWLMPATPEFVVNGEVPYITSKNIKNRTIDFDNVKYISREAYKSISANRPTQKGDILISMIGTLGQTAVIQDDREFYGQNLYLLRLDNTIVNTTYFCEFFNSDTAQYELQGKRNQSTQAYLKANHVEDLILPLPPMELQEQFAAFVEQTDKSKLAIQQNLDKLETLKKSLMQKYFG